MYYKMSLFFSKHVYHDTRRYQLSTPYHITVCSRMWVKSLVFSHKHFPNILKMSRTPDPAKTLLREQIAASIAALTADEKIRQSEIVYNKITNHPVYQSAQRIAIFMSTDQEVNTAPIIKHIKSKGAAAFVPQYAGGKMRMLRLETGDEDNMPLTRHGIAQHSKELKREDALDEGLDLIIAPGVAFSKNGGRVGHGGGYYDKYIANLRTNPETAPKVIAIAFKCQVLDDVPMNEMDQRIDEVVFADN